MTLLQAVQQVAQAITRQTNVQIQNLKVNRENRDALKSIKTDVHQMAGDIRTILNVLNQQLIHFSMVFTDQSGAPVTDPVSMTDVGGLKATIMITDAMGDTQTVDPAAYQVLWAVSDPTIVALSPAQATAILKPAGPLGMVTVTAAVTSLGNSTSQMLSDSVEVTGSAATQFVVTEQ